MLTLQLTSHIGKDIYYTKDNQRKPFLVLKQIYTSQSFFLYLGNGWWASLMFQSYESIGTETKPQEKKVKWASVRILTIAPLGKDSSIKMQVKQNVHLLPMAPKKKHYLYTVRIYGKTNFISPI